MSRILRNKHIIWTSKSKSVLVLEWEGMHLSYWDLQSSMDSLHEALLHQLVNEAVLWCTGPRCFDGSSLEWKLTAFVFWTPWCAQLYGKHWIHLYLTECASVCLSSHWSGSNRHPTTLTHHTAAKTKHQTANRQRPVMRYGLCALRLFSLTNEMCFN